MLKLNITYAILSNGRNAKNPKLRDKGELIYSKVKPITGEYGDESTNKTSRGSLPVSWTRVWKNSGTSVGG